MEQEALEDERRDADREQAELEATGRLIARLAKKGICVHGWRQNYHPTTPDAKGLLPGQTKCLHCGKVGTPEELDAEESKYLGR
jgi:hypothetical protein